MLEIDILAVAIASITSFALGALWYSPILFLAPWCKATGLSITDKPKNPGRVYGLTFLSTLLSAVVLSNWLGHNPPTTYAAGTGLLAGTCLVATSLGINYQFARHSLNHWLIDSGFHISRLTVIGVVLSLV